MLVRVGPLKCQLIELSTAEPSPRRIKELRVVGVVPHLGGSESDFFASVDVNYISNDQCNNFYVSLRGYTDVS
jgi:hypothetical protein